jgi:hypothetical protein
MHDDSQNISLNCPQEAKQKERGVENKMAGKKEKQLLRGLTDMLEDYT